MKKGAARANDKPGRRLAAAACRAARRQIAKAGKLKGLDAELAKWAIDCLGGPKPAAEWFLWPEIGLGGKVPVTVALKNAKGREEVWMLIGRIKHCIPP